MFELGVEAMTYMRAAVEKVVISTDLPYSCRLAIEQ